MYHPIHYKRTNLRDKCVTASAAEKRLHTTILFPSPFLSRPVAPYCTPPLLPSPFSPPPDPAATLPFRLLVTFGDRSERRKLRIIEGSRIEGNRVQSVYGNLTGAWFSKRAEDFVSRANVRSLCTGVRGGRVGERKRIGDYMTMMAILKHNILCGTRKRDVGRQYDGGR